MTVIIESEADIRKGMTALVAACPYMRAAHALTGDPPLRRMAPGFAGLARIVVGQQLSIASAGAIWQRLEVAVKPFDAEMLLAMDDAALRGAGLSAGKVATLRQVAGAFADGRLRAERLAVAGEDDVRAELTALRGIGPWTADIFTMFCVGRADAFAPGDLALQVSAGHLMGLDARPSPDDLLAAAEAWRPWRGVAARLLWSYYHVIKQQGRESPV